MLDCSMGLVSKAILTILMCLLTGGQGMLFICTNWSIGCVSKVILTILMCLLTGGLGMLFICLTAQWAVFLKPFWQFDVSANRGSRYTFYMLWLLNGPCFWSHFHNFYVPANRGVGAFFMLWLLNGLCFFSNCDNSYVSASRGSRHAFYML